MTNEQIIQMIRDAGSIDSDETILTVYAAIRSATKEEDARICDEIYERLEKEESWVTDPSCSDAGAYECVNAIRASK